MTVRPAPWSYVGEPPTAAGLSSVTLVEGSTFAISSSIGDMSPLGAQGLFFEDTRFISLWRVTIDGLVPEELANFAREPFSATFLARGQPITGQADSTLILRRDRYVGNGMREDISIENLDHKPALCTIKFELDADFAHLFDVKDNRITHRGTRRVTNSGSMVSFSLKYREIHRALEVEFPPGTTLEGGVGYVTIAIPPRSTWRDTLLFRVSVNDEMVQSRFNHDEPVEQSVPAQRLREWKEALPQITGDHLGINQVFAQCEGDLGSLRVSDPQFPDRSVIAAGAPWFMALFGRDSLLTAIMTTYINPTLAIDTLRTLARLQGVKNVTETEEQPGKILHEVRQGLPTPTGNQGPSVYFGSVDSTPLFVMALGELSRWGVETDVIAELLPAADRALGWIDEYGDRDQDGFVEYQRTTERGLINQGWKDSFDGISFAAGALAEAPIALCEVQGYVYQAFLSRSQIARRLGDLSTARHYERRATLLKEAFNERYWIASKGYFAVGLDRDKRQIDSLTSNIGHCLWTGIINDDKALATAKVLGGNEMITGWGVRTLSSEMARYNPLSYHNGSVWPHDSAICAAGLAKYGFSDQALAIVEGLLTAAETFGGRPPELFCGFERGAFPSPVKYPAACSPQAWSSASLYLGLQEVLLQLTVTPESGDLTCAPNIPKHYGKVYIDNLVVDKTAYKVVAHGTLGDISKPYPTGSTKSGAR